MSSSAELNAYLSCEIWGGKQEEALIYWRSI